MFIAALFIVTKKWKHPNIHQVINGQSVESSYNEVLLSHKKKVLIHVTTWTNFENCMPSERSQTHTV